MYGLPDRLRGPGGAAAPVVLGGMGLPGTRHPAGY